MCVSLPGGAGGDPMATRTSKRQASSRSGTADRKRKSGTRRRRSPTIMIVSDGRGETCSQLVRAATLQYKGKRYALDVRAGVRTAEAVQGIVSEARDTSALVFYTLVADETRDAMKRASRKLLVPTVDVLGPAFSALYDLFRSTPREEPGLLYSTDRERFDVHEAIDYTLKHDDGRRPTELEGADVVLVGVSRAAKSSTCFYLACEGIKAANVPLIPGIEPPAQLLRLDPSRVIGLRVNVMRLMTVREARARSLGLGEDADYTAKREIAREVNEAHRCMERHGWRTIEASYLAIEELAREVIRCSGLTRRGFRV